MTHWFIIPVFHPDMQVLSKLVETLKGYKVVLVNNDVKTSLRFQGEYITIINNYTNLGFGGGVNCGLISAYEHGAQWMTILNQDLTVTKQAISDMDTRLSNMKPAIVGPFGGIFDKKRWTTIVNETKNSNEEHPEYISGSCVSIHREVISKIGYFYEPYFMYYEDADYSVRACKAGFPILSIPRLGITHHHAAIVGVGSDAHQYYLARNHMLFVERCAPIGVKLYEFIRMPKTLSEHKRNNERGALEGIRDYGIRTFGAYKK